MATSVAMIIIAPAVMATVYHLILVAVATAEVVTVLVLLVVALIPIQAATAAAAAVAVAVVTVEATVVVSPVITKRNESDRIVTNMLSIVDIYNCRNYNATLCDTR
ncbi:uncharacterized protein [Temnothorax longispinosus]|uniref:uncharacterized protein n=1 Tax=Temnothorax longispinosus TaxID=300112 RepID=UPI003A998FCF